MKSNRSTEDYLEAILLLSDRLEDVHQIEIARQINVTQPAVQKAVKALKAGGYVETDGLHIHLTASGREYASVVYHKHCTIRQFLILHGVDDENADKDACEMEHCVSPATFAAMERYVQNSAGDGGADKNEQ